LELAFITVASTNYEKSANPGQSLLFKISVIDTKLRFLMAVVFPKKNPPRTGEYF
jgi:hypothetical protein